MKKTILTTLGVAALGIASYATTFMQVVTDDGNTVRYDVDHVTEVNFVEENVIPQDTTPVIPADTTTSDYAYVDLGLPSGTLWATYNIGATKPEEYGDYFAWGETEPKEVYDWSTYKYAKASGAWDLDSLTKYNFGNYYDGVVDSLSTLLPEDDAATANWGSEWRMPTIEEQRELIEECYWVWTNGYNGSDVRGHIVYKAKNEDDKGNVSYPGGKYESEDYSLADAHVFFPAAGVRRSAVYDKGHSLLYWSSSLREEFEGHARYLYFYFYGDGKDVLWDVYDRRDSGLSVRAVANGTSTSASTISNHALLVYADNGSIHVANAQPNMKIQVFDMNGKVVASGATDAEGSAEIKLSVLKGVYVVCDGNQSTKVVVE